LDIDWIVKYDLGVALREPLTIHGANRDPELVGINQVELGDVCGVLAEWVGRDLCIEPAENLPSPRDVGDSEPVIQRPTD